MSMTMNISGCGKSLEITDSNQTVVSQNIADEINKNIILENEKQIKPDLVIK